MNEDMTADMPDHVQEKLYWAGAYSDEDTENRVRCNAAWEQPASQEDCDAVDEVFRARYPDLEQINHTGHCPEDICGNPYE